MAVTLVCRFREYADLVLEDIKIRKLVMDLPECKNADIAEIVIIRHPQRVTIEIHTARPGVIIITDCGAVVNSFF